MRTVHVQRRVVYQNLDKVMGTSARGIISCFWSTADFDNDYQSEHYILGIPMLCYTILMLLVANPE